MKFTKLITIATVALLLQGCVYSVDRWEIEQALKACADNGGIDYLVPNNKYARCQDGTVPNYSK